MSRPALIISLLWLAACAAGPEIPEALREVAEQARADLASREGVAASEVGVLVAQFETWADGSLGCPRPGQFYAQIITEGYRIVLTTKSGEHRYHGAVGRDPILCQN
ncbi:MAG: hypothetical protein V3U43_04460 [Pseudomonadales bacterium]